MNKSSNKYAYALVALALTLMNTLLPVNISVCIAVLQKPRIFAHRFMNRFALRSSTFFTVRNCKSSIEVNEQLVQELFSLMKMLFFKHFSSIVLGGTSQLHILMLLFTPIDVKSNTFINVLALNVYAVRLFSLK